MGIVLPARLPGWYLVGIVLPAMLPGWYMVGIHHPSHGPPCTTLGIPASYHCSWSYSAVCVMS